MEIDGYFDPRVLFKVVAKNSPELGKRFQLDTQALRESYSKRELRHLAWIRSYENLADGLTKETLSENHVSWKLMTINKLLITPARWVEDTRI